MGILFLCYMLKDIHPGINVTEEGNSAAVFDLSSRIDNRLSDDKASVLKEYLSTNDIIHKVFRIEKGANVPLPIESCYGEFPASDAVSVNTIINQAVASGLLAANESIAFSPDVEFYNNRAIQYYIDDTIMVICWKESIDNKVVNFCEIKIGDPSQFRRTLAGGQYGSSVKKYCSTMTKASNAVIGMNADFYGFRSLGITCYDGTIYRTEQSLDVLFIDENGDFVFYDRKQKDDKDALQKFVDDNHLQFSLAFGPIMIKDGEVLDNVYYPIGEISQIYSRAGIGQIDHLHYLFMTVDNYGQNRPPCTVNQFAEYMAAKGVKQGYNLDGGQTGEIVFNNKIFNLVNYNSERDVSDIIYFATALPENER